MGQRFGNFTSSHDLTSTCRRSCGVFYTDITRGVMSMEREREREIRHFVRIVLLKLCLSEGVVCF